MNDNLKKKMRWLLVSAIPTVLIIGMLLYTTERSGATPDPAPAPVSEPVAAKVICETSDCQDRARTKTRQFKRGKLGNAQGIMLPKKVKRMIAREMNAQAAKGIYARGPGDWFRERLQVTSCLAMNGLGRFRGTCDAGQAAVNASLKETRKVSMACGGAAVAGYLGGGLWWGAGKNAGYCYFAYLVWRFM